jgi:4-amino-4-deoxy-L-arabinose transferase-like glycosyltransferase
MKNKNLKDVLILIILSYFFFIFGNSIVSLTNPDEVFYTLTAKEMAGHNSWMTPILFDQPQFEKPIFIYWLIRIGFILFGGITNFAARFFPAFFAAIGVLVAYSLALLGFNNQKKAFISALILASSGLYIGLARTVFTDMVFSILILLALAAFYWGYAKHTKKGLILVLFFVFMAVAILTKGPLGFFIPFLIVAVFLSLRKDIKYFFCKEALWGGLIFILISFPWYILMIKKYGTSFTYEFFYNDHIRRLFEAEHISNDRWYFYPFSIIGCMFPWSLFVLVSLFYLFKNIKGALSIHLFLACWIVVVFLIFQPAHSKLVSYIFPLFPALALVCGDFIYNAASLGHKNRQFFTISLISWFILLSLPVGLKIALVKFPGYISGNLPVYIFIAVFSGLLIVILNFILRYKLFKVVYAFVSVLPVFLLIIPLVSNDIKPYLTSKYACEYLMKNYSVENTILCSKFYARGVRFYTGKNVAVFNMGGGNFFSPHPIPFLNADQEVRDFLHTQAITYSVLKKSAVGDIERITSGNFRCTLLKVIGDEYLVKIEKL